jgi:hypothetical protein
LDRDDIAEGSSRRRARRSRAADIAISGLTPSDRPHLADGKAKKFALSALMCKLIVLLNHLLKNPKFKLA